MRMRTKRARIVVPEENARFTFDVPMPSELDEINDRHTAGEDTDNRAVIKDLWCNNLVSWSGVDDEDGTTLLCDAETKLETWQADIALCIKLVNQAFKMAKDREDLAEKN